MGIYDRDYYDEDRREGMDFFRGEGSGVRTLIAVNVAVYVLQIAFRGSLESLFAADSQAIVGGQVWRLFTANFLHDPRNPFHLIFNMLIFWFAGRELEIMYGRRSFLKFYGWACFFSMSVWFLAERVISPGSGAIAMGASGAVMASMMLLTLNFPYRQIIFIFIPMQLWVLMAIYVVMDFVGLLNETRGMGNGQVAFAGHLGGVLFGYLYKNFDLEMPDLGRFFRFRRRPRFKVVGREWPEPERWSGDRTRSERERVRTPKVTSATSARPSVKTNTSPFAAGSDLPDAFDSRVDEILTKIAREGQSSLTEDERKVLEEASRRARDKRGGGR
jgi:membrane associated rhomboid family serine protease